MGSQDLERAGEPKNAPVIPENNTLAVSPESHTDMCDGGDIPDIYNDKFSRQIQREQLETLFQYEDVGWVRYNL